MWVEFSPQAGHEQAGRRPALALSPGSYNRVRGLALMCPITNRAGNYPFEIEVISDCGITGAVMSDQLKSIDWRARHAKYAGRASLSVVEQAIERIATLLDV